MRITVATAVACLLGVGISTAHDAQAAVKRETTIPAQGLGPALRQLASERDIQLVYRSEVVGERQTNGAVGELTFNEALTKLLRGTGLTYQYLDNRAVTIVPLHSTSATRNNVSSAGGVWQRFRLAQSDSAGGAPPGATGGSSGESGDIDRFTLQEVVVTATRRAESIRDVPISITAITADQIEKRGLVSSSDYLRGIPGVTQSEAGRSGQAIVIRGMESTTSGQNFASGPTTATYFGETPTSTSGGLVGGSAIDVRLVDIERVEVLRGPQGTAFGNASMGGAVRIIPAAPQLGEFAGKLASGYSVTSDSGGDNYNVQGVVNIPVGERLALRGVGYRYDDTGYYSNRAASKPLPAFQNDLITRYGLQAFAVDSDESGTEAVNGGRIAALFQATDDLAFTLSYLKQKTERDGLVGSSVGTYEYATTLTLPEHAVRGRRDGVWDTEISIANATMEYDLHWADLVATYSYLDSGQVASQGFNGAQGSIAWPASYRSYADHLERVAEVRLVTRLDEPWNFLVGVFYENSEDYSPQEYLWLSPAATAFSNPLGLPRLGDRIDTRDLTQKAAFAEVSWELIDGLTLTGGARTYEYDRAATFLGTGAFYTSRINGVITPTNESGKVEVSDTNFKANLSYKPNEQTMFYAGWAQGFRLGRPTGGLPSVCDGNQDGLVDDLGIPIASTRIVNPDSVDSYELGTKLAMLDQRLTIDAAVFRMEWEGVPFRVSGRGSNTQSACAFSFNTNAGDALSEGVELQVSYQIAEPLRVDVGGAWIDARITQDVASGTTFLARDGDRLPGSPKVSANLSLQYEFELGGREASLRADSIYIGKDYATVNETPGTESGDYVKLDLTGRLSLGAFNVDLFVRNVTNEDAFTARHISSADLYQGYRLRPRTIGFQLGYNFD